MMSLDSLGDTGHRPAELLTQNHAHTLQTTLACMV